MPQHYDCLIVGAGHGGSQTALALRQQGFEGTIGLAGEEPVQPYERPPLSKDYLAGTKQFESFLIRPADSWEPGGIKLHLNCRIDRVDPTTHTAACADGSSFSYGNLVWAAGGKPRKLDCPGSDLQGVHQVRTRADVDAIQRGLADAGRIVVVGGGYIGLETAAVLTKQGKHVTVLEAMERVLARVAGEPLSRFYENEHRANGVDIRLGVKVESLEGRDGGVRGVRLSSGELVSADMVIVGIGIVPSVEPLISAGSNGGNGVDVDQYCRTSLPGIFAVGDCARHGNEFAGGACIRIESVQNASDQAVTVAKFLTGRPEPYRAIPWFWSNQYDLRLQTIGISTGYDKIVVRGDPASRKFSLVYLSNDQVQALDCVNSVKDYVDGRALVVGRARVPHESLADRNIALKSLLPSKQPQEPVRMDTTAGKTIEWRNSACQN